LIRSDCCPNVSPQSTDCIACEVSHPDEGAVKNNAHWSCSNRERPQDRCIAGSNLRDRVAPEVWHPNVCSVKSNLIRLTSYRNCCENGTVARPQLCDRVCTIVRHPQVSPIKRDSDRTWYGKRANNCRVTHADLLNDMLPLTATQTFTPSNVQACPVDPMGVAFNT